MTTAQTREAREAAKAASRRANAMQDIVLAIIADRGGPIAIPRSIMAQVLREDVVVHELDEQIVVGTESHVRDGALGALRMGPRRHSILDRVLRRG